MRRGLALVFAVLAAFVCQAAAEEGAKSDGTRFQGGVLASVDINMLGDWTVVDRSRMMELGFGGALGVAGRCLFSHDWFVEADAVVSYGAHKTWDVAGYEGVYTLQRWDLALPVSAGRYFWITDDLGLAPVLGIKFAWTMKDWLPKVSPFAAGELRDFNFLWGFGFNIALDRNWETGVMGYLATVPAITRGFTSGGIRLYPSTVVVSLKYFF